MFYKSLMPSKKIKFEKFECQPCKDGWQFESGKQKLPFGSCVCMYNFDCSTGVLRDNVGVDHLKIVYWENTGRNYSYKIVPPEENEIYYDVYLYYDWWAYDNTSSAKPMLFFQCRNGSFKSLYMMNGTVECNAIDGLPTDNNTLRFNKSIAMENGQDFIILSRQNETYKYTCRTNNAVKISNLEILSVCYYDKRNFAICTQHAQTIMYGEQLNPFNFEVSDDSSGSITFSDDLGPCQKLVVFKDKLYCFRTYGIVKIVRGKDKKSFDMEKIGMGNNLIYRSTIEICDDKIVFMTTQGLCEFDGNKVKEIPLPFKKILNQSSQVKAVGKYCKGKYYLSCILDFGDGQKVMSENNTGGTQYNNAIIALDCSDYSFDISRGISVSALERIHDKMGDMLVIIYENNQIQSSYGMLTNSGKFFGSNTIKKGWVSSTSDFGYPEKIKFINEITFYTKQNITINLKLDCKVKTISVTVKSCEQTIAINKKAKLFSFEIIAMEGDNEISLPTFVAGVYE